MVTSALPASKQISALGSFFAFSLDTFVLMFRPPFAWREYLQQVWFIVRVSTVAAMVLVFPWSVIVTFTLNHVLMAVGAADYSGAGASIVGIGQIGPVITVLVISGAAATAICADLGARTIREELDALRVMGINPIQTLVVPRILAATTVALLLASSVILTSLGGTFVFSVYAQHISPGAFVAHLTMFTGIGDIVVALIKATLFGLTGGLIGCYKGITVGGGPAGVGNAVNETVVYSFIATFSINAIATPIGLQFTLS
jgi:phospholipid/cholesterol/gamma-HCH transport system permease protein